MTTTLLRGGQVLAAADAPPAQAMLVEGGRVTWVGAATGAPTEADQVVELDGRWVTPAFVDGHTHTTETGLALTGVDLTDARSLTDALDRVAAAATAGRGRPILGHGWDERAWPEGRPPTRAELDRASFGGSVYLSRVDVHSAVVSSSLAAASGLRDLAGWSDDGRVERDAHHAARSATRDGLGPARRRDLQVAALSAAAAVGIAEVHEMSAPHIAPEDDLRELLALSAERADLPAVVPFRGQLVASRAEAMAVAARFDVAGAHPLVGLAGDLCADGSIGSHTAALRVPYADDDATSGHAYLTAEQIAAHVVACTEAGLVAGFHVIGDAGLDAVLAGFESAVDSLGLAAVRDARHRLEHVEMTDSDAVADLARLGVVASVQPVFDAWWGGEAGMYVERLGPTRGPRLNRFRAYADAGIPLVFGSDTPVTPYDPWGAVNAATGHHDPAQRLDVGKAVAAHLGRLAPGHPATCAVWDSVADDLAALAGERPDCLATIRDGVTVHEREGALA